MNSITYNGMDVHTTNYTLCAHTLQGQTPFLSCRSNQRFETKSEPFFGKLLTKWRLNTSIKERSFA